MKTVRVVIADDSPFLVRLLTSYLEGSGRIQVIGTAGDGRSAIEAVETLRPDALTLDLDMPGMGGLEALRQIMRRRPTPCVLISGVSGRAATQTLQALDDGAVDFVLKYQPGVSLDPEALRAEIVAKVLAAARVQVIRSLPPASRRELGPLAAISGADVLSMPVPAAANLDLVVIGASTGGPVAIRELLQHLPEGFSAAIVVVQHLPPSFTAVLANQLGRHCSLEVREADHGDRLAPGKVFVAPGGRHLLFGPDGRVRLTRGVPIHGHQPAIDVVMQSAAEVFAGRTTGILLTGMGDDGAEGLVSIRRSGGRTFAQDEASCVVYGMPRRAVERGAVMTQAPVAEIARSLVQQGQNMGKVAS